MPESTYTKESELPVSREQLWNWHEREGAFERMVPSWQRIDVRRGIDRLCSGAKMELVLRKGPFSKTWIAQLNEVEKPRKFVDTQLHGPFRTWEHEHAFTDLDERRSRLTDKVRYSLPSFAHLLPGASGFVRRELERLFRFRHQRLLDDVNRAQGLQPGEGRTVLVSGSSGLIGRRLVSYLRTLGFTVRGLSRNPRATATFAWDPAKRWIDPDALNGVDAVIHLAGENIAGGLWTKKRRQRILASRIDATRTLVEAMAEMDSPPKVFVSASGLNFHGYRPGKMVNEQSPGGEGFLAEVSRLWEEEAQRASEKGIRTVLVRTAAVLDPGGGALAKMLPAYRLGLGGPIGKGDNHFAWIALDDLVDIYTKAIFDTSIAGPVLAVHPDPITQSAFNKTLGRVLRRPAFLRIPQGVVEAVLGQMGRETLLVDLPARSRVLAEKGHTFRFPTLEGALRFMLGKFE